MADVKSFLFDYFRQRHFDLMPPEVRARFDDYSKTDDFTGNMKWWKEELVGGSVPDISDLNDDQVEELYLIFQNVLQTMYADKSSFKHNDVLTGFITKWFGDEYKTFNNTKVEKNELKGAIVTLEQLLEIGKLHGLPTILQTNLSNVFTDGFTYQDLIDGLDKGKYDTDLKFRDKFVLIANYVDYYGQYGDPTLWPRTLNGRITGTIGKNAVTLDLPLKFASDTNIGDSSNWFQISNKSAKIDLFKADYTELLDKLLTNKQIRDSFAEYGSGNTVSKQLAKATKETDYENKESDDFVPEKLSDSKNVLQRIQDWKGDTFENYLRKFTNPTHGSRVYFSPWSQNIAKALDKVGIKPTEGIDGILKNKDKILEKLKTSATATKHFKWFADTLSDLQSKMPKAFEGALRNGKQMRDLVSAIIIKAAENGKVKEAKTALEILSVSKYGFTTSRTVDAMQKADFSVVSDKNLSWNKNAGVQFVTNAIDKTAKFAMVGAGRIIAGANNLYQHSRTKIDKDIRNNKNLNDAYKLWRSEDETARNAEINTNTTHNVDRRLQTLSSGNGLSHTIIDANTVDAEQTRCDAMPSGTARENLQADIDDYRDAFARKQLVDNWRDKNHDNFQELIAYWDMLESYTKTHSFTLGSIKVQRDAMLKNWGANSRAEQFAKQQIANFGQLTYAP